MTTTNSGIVGLQFAVTSTRLQQDGSPPLLHEHFQEHGGPIVKAWEHYQQQHDAVNRDPRWSEEGRQSERRRLAKAALDDLQKQRALMNLPRAIEQVTASMKIAWPKADDVIAYGQGREIRDQVSKKNNLEILIQYLERAEQGDSAFVWAVDNAPAAFPLIDDATKAKGHAMLRRQQFPEETARLSNWEAMWGNYTGLHETAVEELKRHAQISFEEDAIAAIAADTQKV